MNLLLNTKNLTCSNIKDTSYTETKGSNFSTTIGKSPDQSDTNKAPKGQTTIGLKSLGEEREQETRATIGGGSIVAGKEVNQENQESQENQENNNLDLIRDLNRVVNNSQEITKDMITRALDGSMTIDNRILLGFMSVGKTQATDKDGKPIVDKDNNPVMRDISGFESVANDFINLRTNTSKAVAGAFSTATSPFTAIYSSLTSTSNNAGNGENTQNDKKGIIDSWKANQSANATGILRGGDEDISKIVDKAKEGKATPEELQYLASVAVDGKGN